MRAVIPSLCPPWSEGHRDGHAGQTHEPSLQFLPRRDDWLAWSAQAHTERKQQGCLLHTAVQSGD